MFHYHSKRAQFMRLAIELGDEDPFPSLVEMELMYVSLSFKTSSVHGRMFPKLQLMDLSNCEKLEGLTIPSSLKILYIDKCDVELPASLKGLSSLTTLKIRNQDGFTTFDREVMDSLSSLEELVIKHCRKFRSLSEGGFPSSLVKLEVDRCSRELHSKLEDRKSPEWSMIQHIPRNIRRKLFNPAQKTGLFGMCEHCLRLIKGTLKKDGNFSNWKLLHSLALLEYKHSAVSLARVLFRRASEIDPRHWPLWFAWGWMEWKEGNINTARELYQRAVSIDSTSESAARCLQAWGVLEQRAGNLSTARRLFRSSLNINSQSYVTSMTWAALEEQQGNAVWAEEIRNLYFQQLRTEVSNDASCVMGFLDMFDPALDSIKRLLQLDLISPAAVRSQEI